jgi:hypothetical protein
MGVTSRERRLRQVVPVCHHCFGGFPAGAFVRSPVQRHSAAAGLAAQAHRYTGVCAAALSRRTAEPHSDRCRPAIVRRRLSYRNHIAHAPVPSPGVMYSANPVLAPSGSDSTSAIPFSDGVWFDPADRLYKLYYLGGTNNRGLCYAYSTDGTNWIKPA